MMARSFNGTTDYGQATGLSVAAGSLTLAAWVYRTTVPTQAAVLGVSDGAGGSYLEIDTQGLTSSFRAVGRRPGPVFGTASSASPSPLSKNGMWYHQCVVESALNRRTLYIDGVAVASNTTSLVAATFTIVGVGALIGGIVSNYHPGRVAVPALWSTALTPTEVASLASSLHPSLVRPSDIVSLWPLSGASPEPDVVGGFDLILSGTSYVADPPLHYGRRLKRVGYQGGFATPYNGGLAG